MGHNLYPLLIKCRIGNLLGEQNPDRAGVAARVSMLMALVFAAISR